ncbi:hypothetical protein RIF29_13539 [Crotalaria pallida]|uniref:Protein kinase domain-containing protein n=1 Tax=Crotalaria pallida TaxID=3830 RepID=A0AAN9IPC8_CROPI
MYQVNPQDDSFCNTCNLAFMGWSSSGSESREITPRNHDLWIRIACGSDWEMTFFSCLASHQKKFKRGEVENQDYKKDKRGEEFIGGASRFTFYELSLATKGFKGSNLIGEGGFGKVVAIKQLNLDGHQGTHEFVTEVLMLSLFHHSNLVKLIGYCTDGDQRLLVYEYMPKSSLEHHLFDSDPNKKPLSWNARMKIAVGAARGLEYLQCVAYPPVIYRDLKSANILLDHDFNPKLSDFGLAKLGPVGDNTHVSTRVMGTYGYCAPEYAMSGKLTLKSDIYSFGVVLLELITGCKALDLSRRSGQQNLVSWLRPYFNDRKKHSQMVDPRLRGNYPLRSLHHAISVTAMCLQENPSCRPVINDIVVALEYVATQSSRELQKRGGGGGRGGNNNSSAQPKRETDSN